MTREKWVQCTEELAENPERVKDWKVNGRSARFLFYDKGYDFPIIARLKSSDSVLSAPFHVAECLIEIPIEERFAPFYEGSNAFGFFFHSLEKAKSIITSDCTHILKLTFDGENFQVEPVWKKEST